MKPQLAVAWEKSLDELKYPVLVEPKLDGVRCICKIENGKVTFWSRDNKPFVNFEELEREIESYGFNDVILDGEVLAINGDFEDTKSRARSHRGKNTHIPVQYHLFDIISSLPLISRNLLLHELIEKQLSSNSLIKIVPYEVVHSAAQLEELYVNHCNAGFEGVMVKAPHGFYHYGRNQDWKKLKPFKTADLKITGMSAGQGKASNMMGRIFVTGRIEDWVQVSCEVGTGFTDELRKEMWNNLESYIGKIVEVQYQEVTKDGSLRFPSFKRFREDKDNESI